MKTVSVCDKLTVKKKLNSCNLEITSFLILLM